MREAQPGRPRQKCVSLSTRVFSTALLTQEPETTRNVLTCEEQKGEKRAKSTRTNCYILSFTVKLQAEQAERVK